jgi:RimJ/RimL family protein N-acetyltransferase
MTTLETTRLHLRPWTLEDAPTFARLSDDPEIAANTGTFVHPQPEGWANARITRYLESTRNGVGYTFAVCLRGSLEVVGECGVFLEPRHRRGELGYWCAAAHRGHGYTTEAARAVMQFGFEPLNLQRVQATHFPRNPASGRILERIGMQREGVLRAYYLKGEVFENVVMYAALRTDAV